MISKQFIYYPGQNQNTVDLSKINFCIHSIDLSPFQINGVAISVKTFIYSIDFPFQDILLG